LDARLVAGSSVVIPDIAIAVRIEIDHVVPGIAAIAIVMGNRDDILRAVPLDQNTVHLIARRAGIGDAVVVALFASRAFLTFRATQ